MLSVVVAAAAAAAAAAVVVVVVAVQHCYFSRWLYNIIQIWHVYIELRAGGKSLKSLQVTDAGNRDTRSEVTSDVTTHSLNKNHVLHSK